MVRKPYLDLKDRVEQERLLVAVAKEQARQAQGELRRLRAAPVPLLPRPGAIANVPALEAERARLVAMAADLRAQNEASVIEYTQLHADLRWLTTATSNLKSDIDTLGDVRTRNPDLNWGHIGTGNRGHTGDA